MPRLTACGGRDAAFDDFKTSHANGLSGDYTAMLIDSEDPLTDLEATWAHLKKCDDWDQPAATVDEQVLFMTTCMETWIVADRPALRDHYGHKLQENALPPRENLENRNRHEVHEKLTHATRKCSNSYRKGLRFFQVREVLHSSALSSLPSFARAMRILNDRL